MAVLRRPLEPGQYLSIRYTERLAEAGIEPSVGSRGDSYDNAMAESFFGTLECELLDRRTFRTPVEGRTALFGYIEGWYNPRRRHSSLGYLSPMNFERTYWPGGGVELPDLADFPAEPGSLRAELGSTALQAAEAPLTPQKRREVIRPTQPQI